MSKNEWKMGIILVAFLEYLNFTYTFYMIDTEKIFFGLVHQAIGYLEAHHAGKMLQSSSAPNYWLSRCAASWGNINTGTILPQAWCTASVPRAQCTAILPSAVHQAKNNPAYLSRIRDKILLALIMLIDVWSNFC
jgi:hypothetical protein